MPAWASEGGNKSGGGSDMRCHGCGGCPSATVTVKTALIRSVPSVNARTIRIDVRLISPGPACRGRDRGRLPKFDDSRGGSRFSAHGVPRHFCVTKNDCVGTLVESGETVSPGIPSLPRYGNESAIDCDFPGRPPFGNTLKRIRSNGLAMGEEAKRLATLQSRKYPGEKRLSKTTVKCGGLRFGDVAWRPVTQESIRVGVRVCHLLLLFFFLYTDRRQGRCDR